MTEVTASTEPVGPPRLLSSYFFEDFLDYLALFEGTVQREITDRRRELEPSLPSNTYDPDFQLGEPYRVAMLSAIQAKDAFPAILRQSLLISVLAHTEGLLLRWCQAVGGEPKKERGKGAVNSYAAHLRDVGRLPIIGFAGWEESRKLKAYSDVRNVVVHQAGITTGPLDLDAMVGVVIEEEDKAVRLRRGACEDATRACKAFCDRIEAAFYERREVSGPVSPAP